MNIALYRRYRPQKFQDVIGQEQVTRPLMNALRAERTAHAYLFSGPRGCGKTTSARILARCLNCASGPTDTPCGECDSCRELALDGGGSIDVVEMDAASHGNVEDARSLVERASFAPARDRYKIFIVDEAHMVTKQGFNALLKLVEEPPEHIKFIFATTEPEKVIPTIRSRTHHYPFRLVPPELLEKHMAQLCDQEGVQVADGVLPLVVRAGGGSVRDSLSVLDQLIGGADGARLAYEDAIALLGYTDAALLDETVEAIAHDDGAKLFALVESLVQGGHEPRRFVEDLLQRLRDLVILGLAGEGAADVFASAPRDQFAQMEEQARALGPKRASYSADIVNEALGAMVGATSPRLQLELLCARLLLGADRETQEFSRSAASRAGASASGGERPISAKERSVVQAQAARLRETLGGGSSRPAAGKEARANSGGSGAGAPSVEGWPLPPALSGPAPVADDPWVQMAPPPAMRREEEAPRGERDAGGAAPSARSSRAEPEFGAPTPEMREPAGGAAGTQAGGGGGPQPGGAGASSDVRARWRDVLDHMEHVLRARSSAKFLEQFAEPGEVESGVFRLYFAQGNMAGAGGRHAGAAAEAIAGLLGLKVTVECVPGAPPPPKNEAANAAAETPQGRGAGLALVAEEAPAVLRDAEEEAETPESCQVFPEPEPEAEAAVSELDAGAWGMPPLMEDSPAVPEWPGPPPAPDSEAERSAPADSGISARIAEIGLKPNIRPEEAATPPEPQAPAPAIPESMRDEAGEYLVSERDESIEESHVVGLNVVLDVFGGRVIEEIDRNEAKGGG